MDLFSSKEGARARGLAHTHTYTHAIHKHTGTHTIYTYHTQTHHIHKHTHIHSHTTQKQTTHTCRPRHTTQTHSHTDKHTTQTHTLVVWAPYHTSDHGFLSSAHSEFWWRHCEATQAGSSETMCSPSSHSEAAVCRTGVEPGPRTGPSWLMAYSHVTAGVGWAGPIPRVLPLGALDTPFCGNERH